MLKSSVKYLSYYVKQCHEDVVVMGHIHKRFLQKIQSKGGETIYANAGTWIDLSSHVSRLLRLQFNAFTSNNDIDNILLEVLSSESSFEYLFIGLPTLAVGRPAKTCPKLLTEDIGVQLADLHNAMDIRELWRGIVNSVWATRPI